MSKSRKLISLPFGNYPNKVRLREREVGGTLYLHWYANKKRHKRSLGHKNLQLAKQEAKAQADSLGVIDGSVSVELTLGTLIDIYMAKGTVLSKASHVKDTRRQLSSWREFLGSEKLVRAINPSDVNLFFKWRKNKAAKELTQTTLWHDWKALDRAINFAVAECDQFGRHLLDKNHLKGRVKVPKSVTPARPVASDDYYRALWSIRKEMPWQFEVALCLAHETGHRINSILSLRWSDITFEESAAMPYGSILWRAETDKVKNEHHLPISMAAREALEFAKTHKGQTGGFVLCSPQSLNQLDRRLANRWLQQAEDVAGLRHVKGGGWHMLRRKWASDRQHLPDAAVAAAGGWKDTKTMKQCYQHANAESIAAAVFNEAA